MNTVITCKCTFTCTCMCTYTCGLHRYPPSFMCVSSWFLSLLDFAHFSFPPGLCSPTCGGGVFFNSLCPFQRRHRAVDCSHPEQCCEGQVVEGAVHDGWQVHRCKMIQIFKDAFSSWFQLCLACVTSHLKLQNY